MSSFWSLTKSLTMKFTTNSEILTISTKDEKRSNTISAGRLTKIKCVNFKDIEIIDVESYKKYNLLDDISLESNEDGCMDRCGVHCKCNLF